MEIKTPTDLKPLIDSLRSSGETEELAGSAAQALETCQELLEGIALAAQRMNLGDVYGILRGAIADDDGTEAGKIRAALDFLTAMGIPTAEPDLESLFEAADQ